MKGIFILTWLYLRYHRGKTFALVGSLTVLMLLPMAFNQLVHYYHQVLQERAKATPLILGARGNRYDLILKSLYYYTGYRESVNMADVDSLRERDPGEVIPIHVKYAVQKFYQESQSPQATQRPLAGTELAYFDFRSLEIAEGTPPLLLGDAVVGAEAARALDVRVGDYVLTTPTHVYDPAQSFQLKMPVVGILKANETPDDRAVFVDLKTAWVIDGIGHGHEDVLALEDSILINRERTNDTNLVTTAEILQYQEITDENRAGFHFHGAREAFPVTGILLIPRDRKQRTLALAAYDQHPTRSLLVPVEVMDELMGFVFKVRQFINANYLVIGGAALMLMILIQVLSYKLRNREMETLFKLGSSRWTKLGMVAAEFFTLLGFSILLAMAGSWCFIRWTPLLLPWWLSA